jgi:hypothetical protein
MSAEALRQKSTTERSEAATAIKTSVEKQSHLPATVDKRPDA